MRLRFITIMYTLALCLALGLGLYYYNQSEKLTDNLSDIHRLSTDVQNAYLDGTPISALEDKYDCTLLQCKDPLYSQHLWEAIDRGDIILDLFDSEGELTGKLLLPKEAQAFYSAKKNLWRSILICGIILGTIGYLLILFIYCSVMRPFQTLQAFASSVAKGNLDIKLPMRRNNFFGAFTESFDLMREELKLAKQKEFEANQSKKELVAELSHDIKTPIATIRANCELLEASSTNTTALAKIEIIDSKAATIERLVDNLFHATLDELQVLKVSPVETESTVIPSIIEELRIYGDIHIQNDIPKYLVWMDKLRFTQVVDNIIYNSYKYAGTDVDVSFTNEEAGILIRIADHGSGVPEEELPLVANKFFRGSNCSGKSGSGLGLFLAKSFMEQMKGEMNYYNENGFVVELFLAKV